ncbi:MAG: Fe-S cluster assembly protein SufD [Caldilineaceae bacterium]|nr:Fe-S cluster assembly protein SufD [Caldilineaceae bacterium]MCB9148060.1 Fe-S cluster assembly protein SufD [Caldilineaceae bacterium]
MSVLVKEPTIMTEAAGFNEETVRAASAAKNEPEWMLAFRLAAWRTFESMEWPKPTDEAWRRTRLTGFHLDNFTPFTTTSRQSARAELSDLLQTELDEMESAASLIFQDGGVLFGETHDDLASKGVIFTDLQSAVTEHPELVQKHFMTSVVKPDHNKFTALHAALWDTGAFIYVPKNTKVELPLQVILNQAAGAGGYHHTLLVAEEGAEVTVVDDLLGGEDAMQSSVVEIVQSANSVVRYMNLQDFDHTAWNFMTGRAAMGKDADLRWIQVSWGSRLTKAFLDLDLMGQGGHAELLGIYFPTGRQHIDHQTLQIHRVPNCFSDLLFNGALKEKARSVYMGIIKVLPAAQKTDAFQRNGNLILDSSARADSIPGLEIQADDVRCTHAATAAQVEEEYVFYLMARGLSRAQAERMIVQGFFQAVLDRVPVESVVHKLERVIERKIGG